MLGVLTSTKKYLNFKEVYWTIHDCFLVLMYGGDTYVSRTNFKIIYHCKICETIIAIHTSITIIYTGINIINLIDDFIVIICKRINFEFKWSSILHLKIQCYQVLPFSGAFTSLLFQWGQNLMHFLHFQFVIKEK